MKSTRRSTAPTANKASDKMPVFRQIYARMRDAILNGDMQPGTRVPSWSDLARELKVSRGTVKAAYDCLTGEGFLISRGAAGTVVNPELASSSQASRAAKRARQKSQATSSQPDAFGSMPAGKVSLTFQMGVPAFDVFPRALWARLIARRARTLNSHNMGHLPAAGDLQLRAAIASYLAVARGLACSADQIFITTGYKGALNLIAQALLQAGDAVLLEDPGYPLARIAMQMSGARVVAVPVDDEGINLETLSPRNSKARLAIVTPSHHAPLGMPLSLPRRLALLEWAAQQSAWIVEDDYYGVVCGHVQQSVIAELATWLRSRADFANRIIQPHRQLSLTQSRTFIASSYCGLHATGTFRQTHTSHGQCL
jgi:GntR family transcriptional regulator / MocR family aminotransferase